MAGLLAGCSSAPQRATAPPTQPVAVSLDAGEQHQKALAEMQAAQWPAARDTLEALTAAHPAHAGPWVNLGIVYTRLGDAPAAEAAYRRAVEANPASTVAWNQLGILYRRTGRAEDAREAYGAALAANPDDADTHWNLGILHDVHLPDAPLALHHYTRYRELTRVQDARLDGWIEDLRARMPGPEMTAEVQP
jgi:Tfp pilus assembly protein PilF